MSKDSADIWELDYRPRKIRIVAIVVAIVVILTFTVTGALLRHSDTGANVGVSDQIALILLGMLLGGAALLMTRPRVRVGARGALVQNAFARRELTWAQMRGLSFPDGAASARIELDDDEFISVTAIASNDGYRAVDAVERFRELGEKYAGN